MEHLEKLENKSIQIIREAYSAFKNLGMLWSIGKDSTVLLWLARKAFFGHVPFPLIHIDTSYKLPEMIISAILEPHAIKAILRHYTVGGPAPTARLRRARGMPLHPKGGRGA